MERLQLDMLMTAMIACMDELEDCDPVEPESAAGGGSEEVGGAGADGSTNTADGSEDDEILGRWMGDLWAQIDGMVVGETNRLRQIETACRRPRRVPDLTIEMGLPDLVAMSPGPRVRSQPGAVSANPVSVFHRPLQFSWSLYPGSYNAVMDMSPPQR